MGGGGEVERRREEIRYYAALIDDPHPFETFKLNWLLHFGLFVLRIRYNLRCRIEDGWGRREDVAMGGDHITTQIVA